MPIEDKYLVHDKNALYRDIRPFFTRVADTAADPGFALIVVGTGAAALFLSPAAAAFADVILLVVGLYCLWLFGQPIKLPLKLPKYAPIKDPRNPAPGSSKPGSPDGILFVGNTKKGEELWLTNSDARTHILYLGTTGAGKTEGLKSLVTNAMTWASGFIYIDGKADTDLWASIFSLARRFGRDDDLLILNYMTGNSDKGSVSNSLNPFSSGSASSLVNLLTSLMSDSGGDNAMWKDRAIALLGAVMPALTWKRDHQDLLIDAGVIRDHLTLKEVIKLSRDADLPPMILRGLKSYLDTLPGYADAAYNDDGTVKPPAADGSTAGDTATADQQHGFLSMQFTRTLQSLADDYAYIFNSQAADIDLLDVVLNRRILVVLLPALEKSPDEAANLGKIVVANLKGMMGATLGATIEGETEATIENKPTRSNSPFLTVFDEVGYYTSPGMGVMAAQARSLGFSLIFAAQDLPALEKRVKEEAKSIVANCNLKLFGKLEDPTDTKNFFEQTVGNTEVAEVSGFSMQQNAESQTYMDNLGASIQQRARARYSELRSQKEGEIVLTFGSQVVAAKMFYAAPKKAKALRVQKLLPVPQFEKPIEKPDASVDALVRKLRSTKWSARQEAAALDPAEEILALKRGLDLAATGGEGTLGRGAGAIAAVAALLDQRQGARSVTPATTAPPVAPLPVAAPPPTPAAALPAAVGTAPAAAAPAPSPATPPAPPPLSWAEVVGRAAPVPPDPDAAAAARAAFRLEPWTPAVDALLERIARRLDERLSRPEPAPLHQAAE